ncbi:MAG TPA: hypothetical protein VLC79_11380 [Cellvibrio sp.]|nr:hypothetical protein [Cellvibrio sp.]
MAPANAGEFSVTPQSPSFTATVHHNKQEHITMALTLTDLGLLIQLMKNEIKSLDKVANHSFVDSQTAKDCSGRLQQAKQTAANLKVAYENLWTPTSQMPAYEELVSEKFVGALIT